MAIFGDSSNAQPPPDAISSNKIDEALGSMLDILNDKEQTLWRSTPELEIFSLPYQYICPPFSIRIADSISSLIKLAEGDRETYLPSCFKIPIMNSDQHFRKTSDDRNINVKHKILMQSDNLALVSVDIYAYDRVGMVDAIFELLVLLEQSTPRYDSESDSADRNILSFTSEGHANMAFSEQDIGVTNADGAPKKSVRVISLMIGKESRKNIA
jgi:hypothetical protein